MLIFGHLLYRVKRLLLIPRRAMANSKPLLICTTIRCTTPYMRDIIDRLGGQAAAARLIGVSQQRVSAVTRRGACPAHWVSAICAALPDVRPCHLRPDLYPASRDA
jgi:hypothetical protein